MRQIKLSLLTLTTILAVSFPARAQEQSSTATVITQTAQTDLIGAGASIINTLINPPSRSAEIAADAEIKKAKIAADAEIAKEKLRIEASKSTDRVTPVLNQWGVSRIDCAPGAVFVNGIVTETVCIQPTSSLTAGYYTYDSAKQQLVRTNNSDRNIQTIQNVQTTRRSNYTERNSRNRGF
ncbi:hypothetical protein [Chamaesiphon polymorphus]|uniref:Porin n=1 Tax=Chamaesiphon polymorphus CCALA 037 TaxID=2107692 RepID=A0A2T1GJV4_9CYAN|nr:hypothetical protein [Chamaesiphon polymorphus]PSB58100.1 hypothetical protein C7B77_06040 [Chamaesiphon polymorphus CCALA 037]